jgi:Rps23 Pro-64 3,4-dihydroxylase Tpa1-like proline 4-hydroxylase
MKSIEENVVFKINYEELYILAASHSNEYKLAQPFPNVYLDSFFRPDIYKEIQNNFPSSESDIWKTPSNIHTIRKSVPKQGALGLREYLFSENQRRILMEFNSGLFIQFVERLTGISGLIPDPYFAEGSFAMSRRGGILDIHADFSHHDKLGLERRVNLLIYLNDDWHESYNGSLNFYDQDLNCIKKIYPLGNRVAIFSTSDISFHGFPEPITCPENVVRRSINMYYYTAPREDRQKKKILFPSDPSFTPVVTSD